MGKQTERIEAFDHICRYANTFAVFQGGGAKAIAYLGAYKKALDLGLLFSETAGTSAGSIFAALIAAGASPAQIQKLITVEALKKLAIPISEIGENVAVEKRKCSFHFFKISYWKAIIKKAEFNFFRWLAKKKFNRNGLFSRILQSISLTSVKKLGVYDSSQLRSVVDDWLYEITGKHNVTFHELDRNLWILATDVESKSYKLWSTKGTPSAYVADAVAASCCVPFYYTPFNQRYIDGGLVSNRPDFVFSHLPENYNILSFRTKSDTSGIKSFGGYLNGIVSTLLEGADILQHNHMREVKTISIDVGDFNGLDFSSVEERDIHRLIKNGEEAMVHFYESQMTHIDEHNQWETGKTTDMLESIDQVISIVALWSMNDYDEVWVSDYDLNWVWPLFPTVLKWCGRNVAVRVFCGAQSDPSEKEQAIRRQLKFVGIEVEDLNPITLQRGFFFKGRNGCKAVCYTEVDGRFKGKVYSTVVDNNVIQAEICRISQSPAPNRCQYIPILEKVEYLHLFELLRTNIQFYEKATFRLEKLDISQLYFMSRFVRGDKYVQIGYIYSLYRDSSIENMYPAQIAMLDGKKSFVTPIIVEEHEGKLVVIKGNVRLLFAYKAKPEIKEIYGIVVRNVNTKLPSHIRIKVDKLYLSESKKSPNERYGDDFDSTLVRPIDQALRPNSSYLR